MCIIRKMLTCVTTVFNQPSHHICCAIIPIPIFSGRQLSLEIEPGTFLLATAGSLVTQVEDVVDTGSQGYSFIKLNSGMTEICRPSLYAAKHPLVIVPSSSGAGDENKRGTGNFVVVGHCCETGDLLTPGEGSTFLAPRCLLQPRIGTHSIRILHVATSLTLLSL